MGNFREHIGDIVLNCKHVLKSLYLPSLSSTVNISSLIGGSPVKKYQDVAFTS